MWLTQVKSLMTKRLSAYEQEKLDNRLERKRMYEAGLERKTPVKNHELATAASVARHHEVRKKNREIVMDALVKCGCFVDKNGLEKMTGLPTYLCRRMCNDLVEMNMAEMEVRGHSHYWRSTTP